MIVDIANPGQMVVAAEIDLPHEVKRIRFDGELAYVAMILAGVHVLDFSDPVNPVSLGGTGLGCYTYGVDLARGFAIVAGGECGVHVVDVTTPAGVPQGVNVVTPGRASGLAVSGSLALVADSSAGLTLVDISDLTRPTLISSLDTPGSGRDVQSVGSLACVIDDYNLHMVDVSNPALPAFLGSARTAGSGWSAAIDGQLAWVAVALAGLQAFDISDPAAPQPVGIIDLPGEAFDVVLADGYTWVANLTDGLQVVDIADPAAPRLVGSSWLPGLPIETFVLGDRVLVADYDDGVRIVPAQCEGGVPIYLASLAAERTGRTAAVTWSLRSAAGTAGFSVWRETPTSARRRLGDAVFVGAGSWSFLDVAPPDGPADYWLQESGADGGAWRGPAHLAAAPLPATARLFQNEPNPFNPETVIRFELPQAGQARLAVHDPRGALVAVLLDADLPAGASQATWDGVDAAGRDAPSGMYLVRLETAAGVRVVKVTLAR
ncbi:MAG: hypothetical protein IPK64_17540 [bacterium]|nr:hypothetical protein [bacterium]